MAPDYQTLMLPLLRIAAEGETRVPDVDDRIADLFDLSDEARNQLLPSGRQRLLHNRIHWAKFYLSKAGLLETPRRGVFTASEEGRRLLATDPPHISRETLLQLPAFKEFYRQSREASSQDTDAGDGAADMTVAEATPEEQIDAAAASLNSALQDDLLERILSNTPDFFERCIVDLLVAMGYGGSHRDAARQLGRSGDGGVDGVINEDRLGLDRVYVQAKRYNSDHPVGRPDVQGFVGSLVGLGAAKGVFVTTSTFSTKAIAFAQALQQRVILINGDMLTRLMIEHDVGVRSERTVTIRRIDEDYFADE